MKGNDDMKTPTTDKWRYRREPRPFHPEDVGYTALAAAIVQQAVEDYRFADRLIKGDIKHCSTAREGNHHSTKREVIAFLRSQWYGTLCDINPERIINKLKEEEHVRH